MQSCCVEYQTAYIYKNINNMQFACSTRNARMPCCLNEGTLFLSKQISVFTWYISYTQWWSDSQQITFHARICFGLHAWNRIFFALSFVSLFICCVASLALWDITVTHCDTHFVSRAALKIKGCLWIHISEQAGIVLRWRVLQARRG